MRDPLLDRWVKVWLDNLDTEVKPVRCPKEKLTLTELETIRAVDPEMFEAIYATPLAEMPGDLQQRIINDTPWSEDEERLRGYGYENRANKIRDEKIKYEQMRVQKRIKEGEVRMAQQQKEREAFAALPLGHPLKRPSEAAIAKARADWGITE